MSKTKSTMTDEERRQLIEKLNADLEDFVAERSIAARNKKLTEPQDTRTIDEIAEELKNHPAFMTEIDWSKPLPPEVEGLIQLKYESQNPTACADSYRDDGNDQFKKKKYKIAIDNYTAGIKCRCPDAELNAVLYTNRAAAQFHLGNYRSSMNDCIFARKFKVDHLKAIIRGAHCCYKMNKFSDAIRWCDAALMLEPDHKEISELRLKSELGQKAQERDERKQAAQERKEEAAEKKLLQVIHSHGIKVASMKVSEGTKFDPLLLTALESHNPTGAKVYLDDEGKLHWPVIFFYPEYTETDFISDFCEDHCFIDHLTHMFGPDVTPPPWDTEHKYTAQHLQIYFENKEEEKLYEVDFQSSLLDILRHKKYLVYAGTPGFILCVKGSKFQKEFLNRYKC